MSFINSLFAIIACIFFILLIVGLIKPSLVKMPTRGKAFLVFFGGMVLSSIIFNVTMSDEEKARMESESKLAQQQRELSEQKRKQKESSEELKKLIANVNFTASKDNTDAKIEPIVKALSKSANDIEKTELYTSEILDIYLKTQQAVWSDSNILLMSGRVAENILKELRIQKVKDLKKVRFHVSSKLLDLHGNQFDKKIYTLDYDYPEILKLNLENTILYQDYLKFAQFESNGQVGREVLNAWCADDDNRKTSGNFCNQ